jgi:hypothetical protein
MKDRMVVCQIENLRKQTFPGRPSLDQASKIQTVSHCQRREQRREQTQKSPSKEIRIVNRLVSIKFRCKQCRNQKTTEEKEDGDPQTTRDYVAKASVCKYNDKYRNGANTIEGWDVVNAHAQVLVGLVVAMLLAVTVPIESQEEMESFKLLIYLKL